MFGDVVFVPPFVCPCSHCSCGIFFEHCSVCSTFLQLVPCNWVDHCMNISLCMFMFHYRCLFFCLFMLPLNLYMQTNLIKESIRMGYNDFGDFYYAHGILAEALKSYVRTRDYCTTSKHIIQMCLNVILVSIEMGQFLHVTNHVGKAEQTPEASDPITLAKLKCAAGLAHLDAKKYKLAARKVCCPSLVVFPWILLMSSM